MRLTRYLIWIPAAALVGLSTGLATAAETGIAECDKYFTKVEACIAQKKMTSEEEKAAQSTVDRLRMMLPLARAPQGRAELVKRCEATMETQQKEDKYGCYAPK